MAARGGLSGVHNFFIYRERRMPQNPPHWRKPARTHQTLTRHTSGQPKWPKPVYNKHFSPDQDSERKKPFKNVAREDTPSINLQRKCASQRESLYMQVGTGTRQPKLPKLVYNTHSARSRRRDATKTFENVACARTPL